MADEYIPGVCNIGAAEVRRRRRIGIGAATGSAALIGALVAAGTPRPWRLLVALPATVAASGFLQARMHFCAGFGARGVFNFGATGSADTVEQAEFRREDRRTALRILAAAAAIGSTAGVSSLLLPVWSARSGR